MRRSLMLMLFTLLPLSGWAGELVNVSHAWARATIPGQDMGAAYMQLQSSRPASLTAVGSPLADSVEIHQMSMNKGVMEMRMMATLPLPAGKIVKLEPGGFHLMLFDLKRPLKAGEQLPLTLKFTDHAGKTHVREVQVPIRKASRD